ncbi:hypothetical protein E6W39_24280 [Kitasatospora acidiphila]|uniref:Uncharacterized protein n=1 Tax=Kitasatospora acidiphila TaxID=2567942 RepID=A0A540W723_9ACTN|nr:hypothetical protein [Kitasatospora acidiphila]TQF04773.1 hypothetical protein E6W39_24280 [Kitasatospora acidiphila]
MSTFIAPRAGRSRAATAPVTAALREIVAGVRTMWRVFDGDPNPSMTPSDAVERFPGIASTSKGLTKP